MKSLRGYSVTDTFRCVRVSVYVSRSDSTRDSITRGSRGLTLPARLYLLTFTLARTAITGNYRKRKGAVIRRFVFFRLRAPQLLSPREDDRGR